MGGFVHACSHCKWWSTRNVTGEELCSQDYSGLAGSSQHSHKKIIIMESSSQHCISNRFERHLDLLLGVLLNWISRQTCCDSAITTAYTDNGAAGGQQQILTPLGLPITNMLISVTVTSVVTPSPSTCFSFSMILKQREGVKIGGGL